MTGHNRQCVMIVALVCAVCAHTRATIVHIQFSGTIDYVEDGLPVSDEVAPDMGFLGSYSYDSETPDNAPGDSHYGGYSLPDFDMAFSIGELAFSIPDLGITILNHSVLDSYNVSNITPFGAHGIDWAAATITLRDLTATAFTTDALPLDAPDLADFAFARTFLLRRIDQREPSITGTITAMTLVPEPGTMTLLVVSALYAGKRRQRRCVLRGLSLAESSIRVLETVRAQPGCKHNRPVKRERPRVREFFARVRWQPARLSSGHR